MVRVRKLERRPGAAVRLAECIIRPTITTAIGHEWIDGERIPASGGCIVVANHATKIDPFIVALMVYDHGRIPRFLGKDTLFDLPVAGWILTATGQIPVARMTEGAKGAYDAAVAGLDAGECIVIYPEGTITRDPDLWPMRGKTGAARLALESGAPVIPIGHWGDQELLPPYTAFPRFLPRKKSRLKVGKPVDLSDLRGGEVTAEAIAAATDRIMASLTGLVEDLRGIAAPVERFDPKTAGVAEIGNPKKNKKKDRP